jgi:hypothetical protein
VGSNDLVLTMGAGDSHCVGDRLLVELRGQSDADEA